MQLSAIFLNAEELQAHATALAERLRDSLEMAVEQGDDDLLSVVIGRLFLAATPMLRAFEHYCTRQVGSPRRSALVERDCRGEGVLHDGLRVRIGERV